MTRRGNNRTNKNDEHIPNISDVPIGTAALGTRLESDSLGTIEVPAEHYWGAQTEAFIKTAKENWVFIHLLVDYPDEY
jgi:aspartate ammonia-lyase